MAGWEDMGGWLKLPPQPIPPSKGYGAAVAWIRKDQPREATVSVEHAEDGTFTVAVWHNADFMHLDYALAEGVASYDEAVERAYAFAPTVAADLG
jgi:hypothetical protein